MTPLCRDDKKQVRDGKNNARGDCSRLTDPEPGDFGGDDPDADDQDQQESEFREGDARLKGESKQSGPWRNRMIQPALGRKRVPRRSLALGFQPTSV